MASADGNHFDKENIPLRNNGANFNCGDLDLVARIMNDLAPRGPRSSRGGIPKCRIGDVLRAQYRRRFPNNDALREFFAAVLNSGEITEYRNAKNEVVWKLTGPPPALRAPERCFGANLKGLAPPAQQRLPGSCCFTQTKPLGNHEPEISGKRKRDDTRDDTCDRNAAGGNDADRQGYHSNYSHRGVPGGGEGTSHASCARDDFSSCYNDSAGFRRDNDNLWERGHSYAHDTHGCGTAQGSGHVYDSREENSTNDLALCDYSSAEPVDPATKLPTGHDSLMRNARDNDDRYFSTTASSNAEYYSQRVQTDSYGGRVGWRVSHRCNQNAESNAAPKSTAGSPRSSMSSKGRDPSVCVPYHGGASSSREGDKNENQKDCSVQLYGLSGGDYRSSGSGPYRPVHHTDDKPFGGENESPAHIARAPHSHAAGKILVSETHSVVNGWGERCNADQNEKQGSRPYTSSAETSDIARCGESPTASAAMISSQLDLVASPALHQTAAEPAGSLTGSQSIQGDLQILLQIMQDLDQNGCQTKSGGIRKNLVEVFLKAKYSNPERIEQIWNVASQCGELIQYLVDGEVEFRRVSAPLGEAAAVKCYELKERSPRNDHEAIASRDEFHTQLSRPRPDQRELGGRASVQRGGWVPIEPLDACDRGLSPGNVAAIVDDAPLAHEVELGSSSDSVYESESPFLETALLKQSGCSNRGQDEAWRQTEIKLLSQLDHDLQLAERSSCSPAPGLSTTKKRVRFLDEVEIHSNLHVLPPMGPSIPCDTNTDANDAVLEEGVSCAVASYSGSSLDNEWSLPKLRAYVLNRSKEMQSTALLIRADQLHVNNPLKQRILDVCDQVVRAVSNAQQMREWQRLEIKVMTVDHLQLSQHAKLPGGPNGLKLKVWTPGILPERCEFVHTDVVSIQSTTVKYDCEGSPSYFNPKLIGPHPVHVKLQKVLIGNLDKVIELGALDFNLEELGTKPGGTLDSGWCSFVREMPATEFVKRASVTFGVRQVQIPFDDFDSRRRYDLIQLHNGLQQILELNEFLSRQGYPSTLHFPVDWAVNEGWTLLHCAVHLGCHRLAETLMKRGANPNTRTTENPFGAAGSPLDLAREILDVAENGKFDSNFAHVNIEKLRKLVTVLENHGK
jgi:hypothetical protein